MGGDMSLPEDFKPGPALEMYESAIDYGSYDDTVTVSRPIADAMRDELIARCDKAETALMFRTEQRDDLLTRLEKAEVETARLEHGLTDAEKSMREAGAELIATNRALGKVEAELFAAFDTHTGPIEQGGGFDAWRARLSARYKEHAK